jgi:hypothetical protein
MPKKKISLNPPPNFNSIAHIGPMGLDTGGAPSSSGFDMDNLSPEQANSIPDEGQGTAHFKVHKRSSDTQIDPETGEKTEKHSVRMHIHGFEPHEADDKEEKKPKKKQKLTENMDAQDAVRNNFMPSPME